MPNCFKHIYSFLYNFHLLNEAYWVNLQSCLDWYIASFLKAPECELELEFKFRFSLRTFSNNLSSRLLNSSRIDKEAHLLQIESSSVNVILSFVGAAGISESKLVISDWNRFYFRSDIWNAFGCSANVFCFSNRTCCIRLYNPLECSDLAAHQVCLFSASAHFTGQFLGEDSSLKRSSRKAKRGSKN